MAGFSAIAFDLDGTLIDSVPDLHAAVAATLDELALPACTENQVRSWVGNGAEVLVRRALTFSADAAPGDSELDHAVIVFARHYDLHLNRHSRLYDNVAETLTALKQQGYQLAVVTNKPYRFIEPLLNAFDIRARFSLILGGDSLEKKKPDPLPLNRILNEWNLEKSQLLMVGDSKNDIFAAKSAGVASIGLTYGYNYGEDIGLCGPDAVFDRFGDILTWVNART